MFEFEYLNISHLYELAIFLFEFCPIKEIEYVE
jgi:hypothetical protein